MAIEVVVKESPNYTMNPTAGGRRPLRPTRAFAHRGLW